MAQTKTVLPIQKNIVIKTGPYHSIYNVLRMAVAMCFIGHGCFGVVTKLVWCNYFAVFGIGHDLSYRLMPVIGCIDIILGLCMLLYPVKAIPAWLVAWGLFTAMLRPLSGEPLAELIERTGNFGAPLALLLLTGGSSTIKGWFTRIDFIPQQVTKNMHTNIVICLRVVVFLLFLGHGWLNVMEKKGLLQQYSAAGFLHPVAVAQFIGTFEIVLAFMVLIRPVKPVIFALLFWKMGSEWFYPQYNLLEWVERAGSYGALLALWIIITSEAIAAKITTKVMAGYVFKRSMASHSVHST